MKPGIKIKISGIYIKGFQQFENTYLDFTNPDTGLPAEKICFIGSNGTGKSTILNIIFECLPQLHNLLYKKIPFLLLKLKLEDDEIYVLCSAFLRHNTIYTPEIDADDTWKAFISAEIDEETIKSYTEKLRKYEISGGRLEKIKNDLHFKNDSTDLLIYSPPESGENKLFKMQDVPDTSVNDAIKLFDSFPFRNIVSDQNVQEFWRMLIYLIKLRENEREKFENKKENLNKTKKELIREFDKQNPKILEKLAVLWNNILKKAGLEFDVQNAKNPIQLTDNLHAYIILKNSKERIKYNQLSTGIRNFIFRLGHIYALYFNRKVDRGFLLIDEPENSLYPEFLMDLVDIYQSVILDKSGENNTQFFVSTHNPIIAAQFEPYERITLEWNEQGTVNAQKGNAPAGDDPNDLLFRDFKLKTLMGKQGREKWEEYLTLRKRLKRTSDTKEQKQIMHEINKIGTEYNFPE